MEIAQELLNFGETRMAIERLKLLLETVDAENEWRVHELFGRAFHDLGEARGAVKAYYAAAHTDTILRKQREHWSNYLFALHYLPDVTAEDLFEAAQVYNSLYRDLEPLKLLPRKSKKIHVALISPGFLLSSSARFFYEVLFHYNHEKFFVTAWNMSEQKDGFVRQFARHIDGYFDISAMSYEEAAIQIRDSGADILFDLGGHTAGGVTLQVAAYKPARVQISGIGYFDTTGLDAMDYFLTDKFLANSKSRFTEKLLTVDNAFAFVPSMAMIFNGKASNLADKNFFTYGCLNNFMKITDEYLENLRDILEKNPDARIFFRDTVPFESRKTHLLQRLYNADIDLNRVKVDYAEKNFISDYSKLNAILDTYPYNGGVMTAIALYIGLPVETVAGDLHHSRIGADLVRIYESGDLTERSNFVKSVYAKFAELIDG